jgi:hypothetical protein
MTALAMDRSVDPAERVRKAIEAVATGSAPAVDLLLQEDVDQRVGHCVGVASKRVDVLVGQFPCVVAEHLSHRAIEIGSGTGSRSIRSSIEITSC